MNIIREISVLCYKVKKVTNYSNASNVYIFTTKHVFKNVKFKFVHHILMLKFCFAIYYFIQPLHLLWQSFLSTLLHQFNLWSFILLNLQLIEYIHTINIFMFYIFSNNFSHNNNNNLNRICGKFVLVDMNITYLVGTVMPLANCLRHV